MAAEIESSRYARFALRCSNWAERWFPDSWVFAAVAVITVALATLAMGAKPTDAAKALWPAHRLRSNSSTNWHTSRKTADRRCAGSP